MELIELEKDTPENKPLRLVSDNREPQQFPVIEKQFVNFIFFRVNPDWRKLTRKRKLFSSRNLQSVFNEFSRESFTVQLFAGRFRFKSRFDVLAHRRFARFDSGHDGEALSHESRQLSRNDRQLSFHHEKNDVYSADGKRRLRRPVSHQSGREKISFCLSVREKSRLV